MIFTGQHLCTVPLDPNIGKMLLMGSIFQCLSPALTIAAALAYRNPFVLPINRKEEADAAKRYFSGDSCRFVSWSLILFEKLPFSMPGQILFHYPHLCLLNYKYIFYSVII